MLFLRLDFGKFKILGISIKILIDFIDYFLTQYLFVCYE